MKIGIDITFLFDQYAFRGIGYYGKQIVKELIKEKNNEYVLYGYGTIQSNLLELKLKQTSNIKFVSLGKKRKSNVNNIFFFKFNYAPKIKREKLDLFFASHLEQGLPIGICKTAVVIHDIIPLITKTYSTQNPIMNFFKGIFYRHNLDVARKADIILTDSDFSKNELITKGNFDKNKVVRTYLGINEIYRKENITDIQSDIRRTLITYNITTQYILYYGGIEPNKNVESILYSFQEVSSRFPDLKLVLIGKDFKLGWDNKVKPLTERAAQIYKLCIDLKIRHKVIFTGEVSEKHLPIILSNARLMIHLSVYEGFGFAVLEALAAGIPLIASNRSCYPEVLGDGATMVNPTNYKDISNKIEEMLTNTKLYEDMKKKGIHRAEYFTWERTATETLNAFNNLDKIKQTLKIVYVLPYFYPFTGGAENNCLWQAQAMANLGADVTVLTSYRSDFTCPKTEVHDGIKIIRFARWNKSYYLGFYPGLFWKFLSIKANVIHVHGIGFIWQDYCLFVKKIFSRKIKFINSPHGPFMALNSYSMPASILRKLYTFILKMTLNMTYNIVIQDNPFQEEWIRKYNIPQKKIRLLKIGIKKQIFEPENLTKEISKEFGLSRKFVITFTGRFEEYKGLQHLIEAINKLKYKIKAIKLIAMGYKGNYLNKLKELITEYSLEKHVQIVENPDDETKLNILELSQIFVFPSQWEAFGISQVEAMAKGNAIISSNTEGGKYLIELEKNGYLFEYSDSEAIANYIEKLYKDKILLETIRKNNIEKAKDFVWETIVKDYQKILYETK